MARHRNTVLKRAIILFALLFIASTVHIVYFTWSTHSIVDGGEDDGELPMSSEADQINNTQLQVVQEGALRKDDQVVKIVAFTDKDYLPVAEWWYHRMTALNYTTHTLVLVDQESIDHVTSMNKEGKHHYRFDVEIIDKGKRHKNKVRSLWYHRILYSLNSVKSGQSILLVDVDNIFQRHVSLLDMYNDQYDAMFAFGGNFPQDLLKRFGFTICGGMMFLKATNATTAVLERLRARCDGGTERCDDQVS